MTTERRPSPYADKLPKPYMDGDDWRHDNPPLVTVVFPKYRGRSYPQAVLTAQLAEMYKEYITGDSLYHVGAFAQTGQQASILLALFNLTLGIKGVLVFGSDGILLTNPYQAQMVIDCYQKASLVNDFTAYCHSVINDPFIVRNTFDLEYRRDTIGSRWILPCRLINRSYLEFAADHPASPEDQMQSAAVRQGCHWCPNFSADAFHRVDSSLPNKPHRQDLLHPDGSLIR